MKGKSEVWELKAANLLTSFKVSTRTVNSILKLSDSQVAVGTMHTLIYIWDLHAKNISKTLKIHNSSIYCLVKLNKNQIVSGSYDCTIILWNWDTGDN